MILPVDPAIRGSRYNSSNARYPYVVYYYYTIGSDNYRAVTTVVIEN